MKKNKFNFFENAWNKSVHDYDEMSEKNGAMIKKQKRTNTVIMIVSIVCAFLIWIYASSVHIPELKSQSTVNVKRVSAVETKGYKVEYTAVKVNYTIRGPVFAISQLPSKTIDVYADLSTVNLSEITDVKIVQLPLIVDLPSDLSCTEKSQEYIEVIITKINPTTQK